MLGLRPDSHVLTFGEIMMRLSPPDHYRLEQATSFDVNYGGAEANVALSLAFQGGSSSFVSVVPPTRIGDIALRSLRAYGVDVSRVVRAGERLGSYFFEIGASQRGNAAVYDRKYSAISMAPRDSFDWGAILEGVDAFYVSGVTPALSDETAAATLDGLRAARDRGVTTILDLNYRGKLWTPEHAQQVMRGLMPFVDVCVANDEDAPSALGMTCVSGSLENGIEERDDYVEMAREICSEYGCSAVASVVRDVRTVEDSQWMGMLYLADSGEHWFSPVHDVHVLEGVASGDAFSAALIHAMEHGMDPQDAIDYAIAGSVLKLSIRGDLNLVSEAEIRAAMGTASGSRVSR